MAVRIHIEPDSQPIAGWLELENAARREFEGLVELIHLLELVRAGQLEPVADSAHDGAG